MNLPWTIDHSTKFLQSGSLQFLQHFQWELYLFCCLNSCDFIDNTMHHRRKVMNWILSKCMNIYILKIGAYQKLIIWQEQIPIKFPWQMSIWRFNYWLFIQFTAMANEIFYDPSLFEIKLHSHTPRITQRFLVCQCNNRFQAKSASKPLAFGASESVTGGWIDAECRILLFLQGFFFDWIPWAKGAVLIGNWTNHPKQTWKNEIMVVFLLLVVGKETKKVGWFNNAQIALLIH